MNELAVKFIDGSLSLVRGLGMPYGGPFAGKDTDGEFFSKRTDFMFDFLAGERPLLYHHGMDPEMDGTISGRVVEYKSTDAGVWTIAQLDMRSKYIEAIQKMIEEEALSFSSGAYPTLVQVDRKTGEILRWPWVELSLTPTPANPYAIASKSVRTFLSVPQDETPETETTGNHAGTVPTRRILTVPQKRKATITPRIVLPDEAYAAIDSKGRHWPHHNPDGTLDLPALTAAIEATGPADLGRRHLEAHARAAGLL